MRVDLVGHPIWISNFLCRLQHLQHAGALAAQDADAMHGKQSCTKQSPQYPYKENNVLAC